MRQKVALCDQKDPSDLGFSAPNRRNATSAIPPRADIVCKISHVRKVPILLQKSVEGFREQ